MRHAAVIVLAACLSLMPVPLHDHPDGELVRLHIVGIGERP